MASLAGIARAVEYTASGQDIAVNVDRLSEFRALFDGKMAACTEMAIDPPCCSGTVSCNNGVCEYAE